MKTGITSCKSNQESVIFCDYQIFFLDHMMLIRKRSLHTRQLPAVTGIRPKQAYDHFIFGVLGQVFPEMFGFRGAHGCGHVSHSVKAALFHQDTAFFIAVAAFVYNDNRRLLFLQESNGRQHPFIVGSR